MKLSARALHFVFKIGNRAASAAFFRDILGMKVLRHEEFSEGCEAKCNGEYNNRWSKTMVGYGPEDTHFVIELTYNYPVKSYKNGGDLLGITVQSSDALKRARVAYFVEGPGVVTAPDGYPFNIVDESQPIDKDPVQKVTLASSNLADTIAYWNGVLGFEILEKAEKCVTFEIGESQFQLEFQDIGKTVDHAEAYGRIAFSIPLNQLSPLEQHVKTWGGKILTPFVTLDTPGKASVSVVILADPDGHEICFVGDEAFRELSKVDPDANELLDKYIRLDKS